MKIERCEISTVSVPLKAPFTIAFHTTTEVDLAVVRLIATGGIEGLGVSTPFEQVTGESFAATETALLQHAADLLQGRELLSPVPICRALAAPLSSTPAARAALDMAVHDLWGKSLGRPLVELLGRAHAGMLTSMTLGIRTLDESLEEAREFLRMGYRILKVKIGRDLNYDVELLTRMRETHGDGIGFRVDANQGYSLAQLHQFIERTRALDIEFIEQPLPVASFDELRSLPEEIRSRLSADESVLNETDALRLSVAPQPAAILNIKLMKCGGIHSALRIANIAEAAGQTLMWGCMVESCVGLAAALHAALACPNTRYLDLDGDYDLVEDIATGGLRLQDGVLYPLDKPGLGVSLKD